MLVHQEGSLSRPPLEATRAILLPSLMYNTGLVRFLPVFQPVVVTRRTGAPRKLPPSFPLERR